jgi:hypothetical protein
LKTAEFKDFFEPGPGFEEVYTFKACKCRTGIGANIEQQAEHHPDGKGNKQIIGTVGFDYQLPGHERMKIAAGLGTPESKFTCFIGRKFDFRDPVPVRLKLTVIIFPAILEKDGVFSHDKLMINSTG